MLKRQTRLRREYLHKRHLNSVAEAKSAKKTQVQKALDSGVKLPKAVRKEAQDLAKEMLMDGDEQGLSRKERLISKWTTWTMSTQMRD
jgi:U3 small nucleolar ribonucleoprotein protein IMP4